MITAIKIFPQAYHFGMPQSFNKKLLLRKAPEFKCRTKGKGWLEEIKL